MTDPDELAKIHTLNTLFGEATGNDAYLTRQIKTAIEFSLTGSVETPAPLECFTRAVLRLLQRGDGPGAAQRRGFFHLDLRRQQGYDPLWLHRELVAGLKGLAGYESALLLVTGLRGFLCPQGRYWTRRLRSSYADAITYIDRLAAAWATPSTRLTVCYF